jgi:DNA invertase Pin-like site-specific DNA recombinase
MLDALLDERLLDTRTPAIGYIRVSLAREEMISPELQREAIEKWAARTGHRILPEWVVDLDKTGRNFKRRIMQAIERVERGEAKVIAVWKYSRFGRNRAGIELNLTRIEKVGGQLMSATEEVDATTATGWFQRDVIFSVATFESKRAGEQWKETHDWRRQNGLPAMGRSRFGYIWHPRKRFKPDGTVILQEERYEPDPVQGPALAALYQRFVDGESFRGLALWLSEQGFRTTRGDYWSVKALTRVMDSGFAAGYLRLHANCPEQDCYGNCKNYKLVKHPEKHHPTLISEELWQAYTKQRQQLSKLAPRSRSAGYPLTGLVRCGRCEAAAKRVRPAKSKPGPVKYVCTVYSDKGVVACAGTRAHEDAITNGVRRFLETVASRVEAEAESSQVELIPPQASPKGRQDLLKEEIERLGRAVSRHMRAYALSDDDDPGGVTEREYREVLQQLRSEKAAAEAELAALVEKTSEDPRQARLAAVRVATGLLDEWNFTRPDRVNFLLRKLVEKVVLQPDGSLQVYPTWSAEPWIAPPMEVPPSKAEAVRTVGYAMREAQPGVTSQRIADELAQQGVKVTADYVRGVLSREVRLARQRAGEAAELG